MGAGRKSRWLVDHHQPVGRVDGATWVVFLNAQWVRGSTASATTSAKARVPITVTSGNCDVGRATPGAEHRRRSLFHGVRGPGETAARAQHIASHGSAPPGSRIVAREVVGCGPWPVWYTA